LQTITRHIANARNGSASTSREPNLDGDKLTVKLIDLEDAAA
jgi:hypothetical protein